MALDMFMKIETPNVPGESKDKAFAGDIDVLAWSWGASNSGTTHMGGGGGAGKANFQDLSFTKYVDKGTNVLLTGLAKGTHFAKATLTMRKAGDGQAPYLIISMEQVLVTSLSTGGSGGEDRLTENVTLNFGKVKVAYKVQDAGGVLSDGPKFGWDIEGNAEEQ
jgi:type VI secretion system secreted protein Hcp